MVVFCFFDRGPCSAAARRQLVTAYFLLLTLGTLAQLSVVLPFSLVSARNRLRRCVVRPISQYSFLAQCLLRVASIADSQSDPRVGALRRVRRFVLGVLRQKLLVVVLGTGVTIYTPALQNLCYVVRVWFMQ